MKNIRCNCSSINIVLYIINIVINVFINVTQIRVSVCLFLSSIGCYNCHLVIIQIHSTGHQIIVYKYMKNNSKALILIVYTSLSWATLKTKFRFRNQPKQQTQKETVGNPPLDISDVVEPRYTRLAVPISKHIR